MVELEGIVIEREKRCLCDLPIELLEMILSHLSVLDYLSLRAVCKCWRSAFSNCSEITSQNQAHKQLPWFLILRTEKARDSLYSSVRRPLLRTTGSFGDLSTKHIYKTDTPELCGTQILLSKYGWLLLFSSKGTSQSLFFFNLFSRARIDLPFKDVSKLLRPVFDISAPPTSTACMVFAISCHNSFSFEVSTCNRGESSWTTNVYKPPPTAVAGPVVNTVFTNGIWYCIHQSGDFSTFDVFGCRWNFLGQLNGFDFWRGIKHVSFTVKRGDLIFLRVYSSEHWYEIALRDRLEIVKAYSRYFSDRVEHLLRMDVEGAILELRNVLAMDSFNADAWCADIGEDGVITFRWHRYGSFVNCYHAFHELDFLTGIGGRIKVCPRHRDVCSTTIMWIEPLWVHPLEALKWTA